MPKYIECKSAINRIKEYASDVYGIDLDDAKQFSGDSLPENYCEGLYEATELVDDIPAADVAPVVHGRWKPGRFNLETGNYEEQCTRCRNFSKECGKPYCPNCGAMMDGESTKGDVEHGMGGTE